MNDNQKYLKLLILSIFTLSAALIITDFRKDNVAQAAPTCIKVPKSYGGMYIVFGNGTTANNPLSGAADCNVPGAAYQDTVFAALDNPSTTGATIHICK